jgi:O-antigen/teichoic acid export membrane protein
MRFRFQLVGQNVSMLLSKMSTLGVSFLLTVMASRFLPGVAEFGQLMLISAYYMLLRDVSVYSFKSFLVRELIHYKKHTFPISAYVFFFSAVLIGAGTAILALALKLLGYSSAIIVFSVWYNLSLIFEVIVHNNESLFESQRKFGYLLYTSLVTGLIRIGAFFLFNVSHPCMRNIIYSFVAASLICSLLHLFILFRYLIREDFSLVSARQMRRTVSVSSIFFFSSICYGLVSSLDVMTLSKMSGDFAVGIYSPAAKLNKFCNIFIFSFIGVVYPHLVSILKTQPDDFPVFSQKILAVVTFFSVPLQFFFSFLAKYAIILFFGYNYLDSIPVLKILIFAQMPYSIYFFCSRYMLALNQEKLTLRVDIFSLILNFVLLLVFTRFFSVTGTAMAILCTSIFILGIYIYYLGRQTIVFPFWRIIGKNLVFLLVAGSYFIATFTKDFTPARDALNMAVIAITTLIFFFLIKELSFLRKKQEKFL